MCRADTLLSSPLATGTCCARDRCSSTVSSANALFVRIKLVLYCAELRGKTQNYSIDKLRINAIFIEQGYHYDSCRTNFRIHSITQLAEKVDKNVVGNFRNGMKPL